MICAMMAWPMISGRSTSAARLTASPEVFLPEPMFLPTAVAGAPSALSMSRPDRRHDMSSKLCCD